MRELCLNEIRCVPILEHDVHRSLNSLPRIARNKVHLIEVQHTAKLLFGAISVAHIYHIVLGILFHHIPRTAAQAKALALPDGVKPEALVLANLASGFNFNDVALALTQMAADEVVIVNFPQKANALAVLAKSVRHICLHSNSANLSLGHTADGEHQMLELLVGYLRKKVGLVLNRVDCRSQIFHTVNHVGGCIVPGCRHVELTAPAFLEISEFYHLIAHHVGVGR